MPMPVLVTQLHWLKITKRKEEEILLRLLMLRALRA